MRTSFTSKQIEAWNKYLLDKGSPCVPEPLISLNQFLDAQEAAAKEPRYVGPGDEVMAELYGSSKPVRAVVLKEHRGFVFCVWGVIGKNVGCDGLPLSCLTTTDGHPIAGYRDQRDRRIEELEEHVSILQQDTNDYQSAISELEAEVKRACGRIEKLERDLEESRQLTDRIGELESHLAAVRSKEAEWIKTLNDGDYVRLTDEDIDAIGERCDAVFTDILRSHRDAWRKDGE